MAQIHNMDALLLDANKLSEKEKKNAIASLIFLTEKRDGMIKARQCADGRKQQNFMVNEDSTSPTVTMESIFVPSMIGTKENREVALVDLSGAYLHAENDQDVIMFMRGRLAKLMTMIALQT